MAVTVQMQFESAVTEMYQDAFVGSSIENGATIITFDLRQHDWQQEVRATSTLDWRKEAYHVDIHELSTFYNPIKYRFILAQGYYLDNQHLLRSQHKARVIGECCLRCRCADLRALST